MVDLLGEDEMFQPVMVSATLAVPLDESGLIRAAQNGDQDAFERLVREYDQSVLRIAVNILRSPDEARDVYQEAFLKVYRNLNSFRFDCSFHTWLYRIVTNICLDHLRRRKVRKEESTLAADAGRNGGHGSQPGAEEGAYSDPERQTWNQELSGGIARALAGLTPRERTVFELRQFAKALRLGHYQGGRQIVPPKRCAKNCLFRATQKMRMSLKAFV